jgi:hypothetical protein
MNQWLELIKKQNQFSYLQNYEDLTELNNLWLEVLNVR